MKDAPFETRFNFKQAEPEIYEFWEKKGVFTANPHSTKTPFVIVIPPPNITGSLHMGHALNNTLQDITIRYKRMQNFEALYVPGTDHAGIATQYVVEKELLATLKKTRFEIGREEFLKRVWEWKEKYGNTIILQLKKLGCSCDWTRTSFTMDENYSLAVRTAFVKLYNQGLIYKGRRIVNWCPRCLTSLSDLEVEHKEVSGRLWYIKYPFSDASGFITIATTRPETMLGDTAVAVNPFDERYKKIVKKRVTLPFVNRTIPIIQDEFVDPEFGTGALKITPAHDANDFEIAIRHNLPHVVAMDEKGVMNENAGMFKGLDRFQCREKIVEELEKSELLEKEEEYTVPLSLCYRCRTILEPYLSQQWFVSMVELVKPAIKAVKEGHIRFIPRRFESVYIDWLENIKDWCVSRQLWWGHQIPVWYCNCGKEFASVEKPEACPSCKGTTLRQDENVLDTWFSSALWPFATLGWPKKTDDLEAFYPTSTLITGREIINLWVARMVITGYAFLNKKPFFHVFINPTILNPEGKRMSKSLGTGVDPLELIDNFGADATRFGLAVQVTGLQDIKFIPEKILVARNFITKVWNAGRLIYQLTQDFKDDFTSPYPELLEDKWILSRLNKCIGYVTESLENYEYSNCAQALYEFVWADFCDWYLELAKKRKDDKDAQKILLHCLEKILIMLHPIIPFVTEAMWQKFIGFFGKNSEAIATATWPDFNPNYIDEEAEHRTQIFIKSVRVIRDVRNKFDIKAREKLEVLILVKDEETARILEDSKATINSFENVEITKISMDFERPRYCASGLSDKFTIFIPLAGRLDIDKEILRQQAKRQKLQQIIDKIKERLDKPEHVSKAPPEILQNEKEKLQSLKEQVSQIDKLIAQLEEMKK
jgi:valyl-tRNA synthetase